MTCNEFLERAADLVETDRAAPLDAELAAHLASCDACREALADLRSLRRAASELEPRPLPPAAWHHLAARLAAESRPEKTSHALRPRAGWAWIAAAAALLVAAGASLWIVTRPPGPSWLALGRSTRPPGNASQGVLVQTIENELELAAQHYEKAIAGLEQVASASDSPLDPEVMATVRKNLEVIDGAIDESRAALTSQPDSRLAQESLFDAFRRKVALLQDTISLMNEMRKGDELGAARIVGDLGKS